MSGKDLGDEVLREMAENPIVGFTSSPLGAVTLAIQRYTESEVRLAKALLEAREALRDVTGECPLEPTSEWGGTPWACHWCGASRREDGSVPHGDKCRWVKARTCLPDPRADEGGEP